MKTFLLSAVLAVGCLVSTGASAGGPLTRCGWVLNPTPGNWYLSDGDGDWTLATQGSDEEAVGMENIGDISAGDYEATNGNYGYACGCMKVRDDPATMRILEVLSFRQSSLAKCKKDPHLPSPR
ncbi:Protein of unknown function [Ensifer adhaerens]|nr:Protein of unknown function [Ensifer adhaerens]HZG31218.1 DUF4087 domain-containing protein [Ensifer sp.]